MIRTLDVNDSKTLKAGDDHYRAYVGPPDRYDLIGASQFALLFMMGLREHHRLLDVGCGSLRLGRLAIPYLLANRYFGIEPEAWLVDEGFARELGRDALALKGPRFDHNSDFRADMFGVEFDFIIAQSVFSHTGIQMAAKGIKALATNLAPDGVMLTNWWIGKGDAVVSPTDVGWVYPECVVFPHADVDAIASEAGLVSRTIPWAHPALTWSLMARDEAALPTAEQLSTLVGAQLVRPS